MKSVLALLSAKKVPECNLLVGTNELLIRFASKRLGPVREVEEFTDEQAKTPGVFAVASASKIHVLNEKVLDKIGVWDVSQSLEPNSPLIKDLFEEAARMTGVKVSKEDIQAHQWKLFEGSGGPQDIDQALLEATQWVQLPPDPKPELPWFNPEGWFRLAQVERELSGYLAYLKGDKDKMSLLGVKESRVSKWSLSEERVNKSLDTIKLWQSGRISEDSARIMLKAIWVYSNNKVRHVTKAK
jgi:hypothetical protein